MKLTIVTHTCPKWGRDIARCVDSVSAALPAGSTHEIIEMNDPSIFQKMRFDALSLGDIIVFVDDDDYISPDSLGLCLAAMGHNDIGLAFTNEVIVQADGSKRHNDRKVSYDMACIHPQIIHHMTAINTKYVTQKSMDLALKYNCGIEWIMKVEAAFNGSAIHIPIDGYYWVQHHDQHHRDRNWQSLFAQNTRKISNVLKSWNTRKGEIPVFKSPVLL